MSLKELQLPSIATLRAIAALKSPHLALVRPARLGLGFEAAAAHQKTLAELEQVLGGPGRLSLPYALRLLLDALTGLGVLHRTLGFVHGEVQPEHIVLGEDGVGRLMPVVRPHWARGEPRAAERLYYLAPEKLLGDRVDVRSDVFSVGVLLWEALAGQRLLELDDVDAIVARFMAGGVARPHAPEGEAWTEPVASVAMRALAVDPANRYASVAELKAALEEACSRYLASPPGMAELFQNPKGRARADRRDSLPPESQRATLPPAQAAADPALTRRPQSREGALDAAAEQLSRGSFASLDLDDEATNPRATAAPARRGAHVDTLLGVPTPFVDRESSPDSITLPFSRIPPSVPVIITPLPSQPPRGGLARSSAQAQSPVPAPAPPRVDPLPAAPTRAALQASIEPSTIPEPSFELVRPRRGRRGLWLLLGAATAIGAFAARPWLAQQVAAASDGFPIDEPPAPAGRPDTPIPTATGSDALSVTNGPDRPRTVGIASTPAVPSAPSKPLRARGGAREEHVVIDDSLQAQVAEPTPPTPIETPPEVAAPPPPAATPPAPRPKANSAPVNDVNPYGI